MRVREEVFRYKGGRRLGKRVLGLMEPLRTSIPTLGEKAKLSTPALHHTRSR
jgi:hypothetical protein